MILVFLASACSGPSFDVRGPAGSVPAPEPGPGADTAIDPTEPGSSSETATDTGTPPGPPRLFAYVGSGDGRIRVFTVDPATGALTGTSEIDAGPSPSFLAFSPDLGHLYAVNEGSSELSAFSVDAGTGALGFLNRVPSNGSGPVHVTVDAAGATVFAANYGGGTVTMIALADDGGLGATRATLYTGPNAHQLVLDPTNRYAFVPNLGADDLSQLTVDLVAGTIGENAVPRVSFANGAGPRHLVFHPSAPFAYVIAEDDDTVISLAWDATTGRLSPMGAVSTLPTGTSDPDSYGAELAFGASGRFLYGTNRGHDSLVVYAVDSDTGALAWVADTPTDGSWPRHFSITPAGDLLLVGNQFPDEIVAFRVDPVDGTLQALATTPVPSPAFVGVVDLR